MTAQRASVIGIGMIGGSVAAALRKRGWHVSGQDVDADRVDEAKKRGVIDAVGHDPQAQITFVATPVSAIVDTVLDVFDAMEPGGIVTDVGSVKGSVVDAIDHPRFVGGHPMAGSENNGLAGINEDLFDGATWVLTPGVRTEPKVYIEVRNIINSFGAEVVTLDAYAHDDMVATISHVPHITASSLMSVTMQHARSHDALLRLASGGFRDMTRVAAGHPALWADIALGNRDAIVDCLGRLTTSLDEIRELIATGERDQLEKVLAEAAEARRELPKRQGRPAELVALAILIPDTPGALGQVFGILAELGINVEDLEINHALDGNHGTLSITVGASGGEQVRAALEENGFRSSLTPL